LVFGTLLSLKNKPTPTKIIFRNRFINEITDFFHNYSVENSRQTISLTKNRLMTLTGMLATS